MKFSDFVSVKAIRADLGSLDKASVVSELVESLLSAVTLAQGTKTTSSKRF